jgi:hypothetical protein
MVRDENVQVAALLPDIGGDSSDFKMEKGWDEIEVD